MFDQQNQPMPPCRPYTGDDELDQVLKPAQYFARPSDVVRNGELSLAEKRAILSSWASDACAVESQPSLRLAPGATTPVSFDDIVDALQRLDGIADEPGKTVRGRGQSSGSSHGASA